MLESQCAAAFEHPKKANPIFHSDYEMHKAAADQSSQERLMALPRGERQANKGQVTPSLSQISLHAHTNTHTAEEHTQREREGEIDCGPVYHLNGGGRPCHSGTVIIT